MMLLIIANHLDNDNDNNFDDDHRNDVDNDKMTMMMIMSMDPVCVFRTFEQANAVNGVHCFVANTERHTQSCTQICCASVTSQ